MKQFSYIILLFLALFAGGCGEKEKPVKAIQLSYVSFAPGATFVEIQMDRWIKEVEQRSGGRVKINTFPAAELLNSTSTYDGIIEGKADIGTICTAYQPDRFPLTNAVSLPLGFPDAKMASKAMIELFNMFTHPEFDEVEVLTLFTNAPSNIMSMSPVRTYSDIKGMKIRAMGGAADVLDSWGAMPVRMEITEVPEAVKQDSIEGIFTSLDVMRDFNLAEKYKYITMTEQVVYPFAVVMNKARFNQLPEDIQEIFTDLFREQSEWTASYLDNHIAETVDWAAETQGVEIIIPTVRQKERMERAAASLVGDWAIAGVVHGVPTEEILATLQDFTEEEL